MTVLAIARNAFLESIRQPVFAVVLVAGTLALVFNVNLAAFTLEDDNKLLVDLGLSTLLLTGLLLAAFTATSVLAREIENRTVLTVVSKPVSRAAMIVGKYLGVSAALLVGYWALAVVFLLTVRHRVQAGVRMEDTFDLPVLTFSLLFGGLALGFAALMNYLYRRPFPSVFAVSFALCLSLALGVVWCVDREWRFQSPLTDWNPQLLTALGLIFQAILVLAAVSLAASTRLGQIQTLLVSLGGLLLGLVIESFLGRIPGGSVTGGLVRFAAGIVPNLQFFWPADALTQGHAITPAYFATVSLYAACLILALISLAVLMFQHRDVG